MNNQERVDQSSVVVAAIWCRVSTDGQRELSLDSQEAAVIEALRAQGIECPPQYVLKVDWSSLDLMSCPEFQKLQRWIENGTIQAIGTLDRDRLQAQGLQRLVFLAECKERGVRIVTVQGVPMLDGGEGQLVEMALALGKERSVMRAQQGVRDGLRDRARLKGLPASPVNFYGYEWNRELSCYQTNEHYSGAVEVWRLGLSGKSMRGIATELTSMGVQTPGGAVRWWPYSVRHILKNSAYRGVIESLKTESVVPKKRRSNSYGKSGRRSRPENERIYLEGLVEQPIVTKEEYDWMQQHLEENQLRATRNTRIRSYLLRGIIECAACGRTYAGATVRRGDKTYSYYNCGAMWSSGTHGVPCPSRPVSAARIEDEVFGMVGDFLSDSEGIETEMRRRQGMTESSEASLVRELEGLGRQEREERDAEGRAFRLASRGSVNESVYEEEIGLIHTRQRWLADQRQRVQAQLVDLERYRFDPAAIGIMRQRLDDRLMGATIEDRRFVLEAIGARVIMHHDKTWELEVQVPRNSEPADADVLPIANSRPEWISTVNAT